MCRVVNDRATQKAVLKIKFLGYEVCKTIDTIQILIEEQRVVFLYDEQFVALLEVRIEERESSGNVGKPWCNMTIRMEWRRNDSWESWLFGFLNFRSARIISGG